VLGRQIATASSRDGRLRSAGERLRPEFAIADEQASVALIEAHGRACQEGVVRRPTRQRVMRSGHSGSAACRRAAWDDEGRHVRPAVPVAEVGERHGQAAVAVNGVRSNVNVGAKPAELTDPDGS
jgi:hypothetical protein